MQVLHGAHAKDCEVTSFAFSKDNNTLLSRAADDTLKVSGASPNAVHSKVTLFRSIGALRS